LVEINRIQITKASANGVNNSLNEVAFLGTATSIPSDKVELSKSSKNQSSKIKKIIIAIGVVVAIVAIGKGVLISKAAKKINNMRNLPTEAAEEVFKSLEDIETRFAQLENNLPQVQDKFKEIFLRNDLTQQQTLEILRGYKEVEKLGLTCSKKEYVEAVFKEAKKNYQIYSPNMKIEYNNPTIFDNACGVSLRDGSALYITEHGLSKSRHELFEVIHHELRHSKQGEYVYCCFPDGKFTGNIYHEFLFLKIPNEAEYNKFLDEIAKKTGTEDFCDKKVQAEIDKKYNVKK